MKLYLYLSEVIIILEKTYTLYLSKLILYTSVKLYLYFSQVISLLENYQTILSPFHYTLPVQFKWPLLEIIPSTCNYSPLQFQKKTTLFPQPCKHLNIPNIFHSHIFKKLLQHNYTYSLLTSYIFSHIHSLPLHPCSTYQISFNHNANHQFHSNLTISLHFLSSITCSDHFSVITNTSTKINIFSLPNHDLSSPIPTSIPYTLLSQFLLIFHLSCSSFSPNLLQSQ